MGFLSEVPYPTVVAILLICLAVGSAIYLKHFYVDLPRIEGLPEIPGGSLLSGHLYLLGNDHASAAEAWSKRYGWPVFQLRLGFRRTIIINSFEAAREWMVKNQTSTLDRPWFYTFHGVLSSTSGGFTVQCELDFQD